MQMKCGIDVQSTAFLVHLNGKFIIIIIIIIVIIVIIIIIPFHNGFCHTDYTIEP